MRDLINCKKAKELFEENAILIGDQDVIPSYKIIELLGSEAENFAWEHKGENITSNIYGIGNGESLKYFYYDGFMRAITYYNISTANKKNREVI